MSADTIVAIATPSGRGGVGIIRLSGSKAYIIATFINGAIKLKPRVAAYCSFYVFSDQEKQLSITEESIKKPDLLIDQGLMIYFQAPNSFTGEDVVEIHAHGSPIVLDYLIETSIHLGARLARPGEFSERAFLNGKIDLAQAEAIADLINASTKVAAQMALKSLQGAFSAKINQLNEKIIFLRAYVEAAIDFPEEEIDFLGDGKVASLLQTIINEVDLIRSEVNQGVIVREGLSVVIAGRPNAGKSTLINYLAGRDVAIVTEIAGTTRDVMREYILLDDIPLHIIDTAGLRDSNDLIEKEGIKRAWNELKQADCVLLIIDVNEKNYQKDLESTIVKHIDQEVPIITVYNKIDTLNLSAKRLDDSSVYISAKSGQGIDCLKKLIKSRVGYQPTEGKFIARRRHLEALDRAKKHLIIGQDQLKKFRAGELLAEDLRIAHRSLGEITGEFTSEDLLGQIFSSFCIGK